MDLVTEYYLLLKEDNTVRSLKWGVKGAYVGSKLGQKYSQVTGGNTREVIKTIGSGAQKGYKVGSHLGKHAEKYAGGASALGAYTLYKIWKKWKAKKSQADTPQEKEMAQKKMNQTKVKIDAVKKKSKK